MADKKYKLNFTMTDGSERSVEFDAPQGPQGEKGEQGEGVFAFSFNPGEACEVTAADISAAVKAGKICVAVDVIFGHPYIYYGNAPLNSDSTKSVPTFVRQTLVGRHSTTIDYWFMQLEPDGIARTVALMDVRAANPYSLTINGKSYDGSAEVNLNITGGSGTAASEDIFVVHFSITDGTADKTQDEIKAAVSDGKVCIALDAGGHVYVYAGNKTSNSDSTLRVPTFVDNANYEDGTLTIEYVQFYSDGTLETFYREASLGGGAADNIFVINMSLANGTYDTTYDEIRAAINAGKMCIAVDSSGHSYTYVGMQKCTGDVMTLAPTFVDPATINDGTLHIGYIQFFSTGVIESFSRDAELSGGGSGLPEPEGPHLQLVTDSDGNWTQVERLAWAEMKEVDIFPEHAPVLVDEGTFGMTEAYTALPALGTTCTVNISNLDGTDSQSYESVAREMNVDGIMCTCLGNGGLLGVDEDNGEPFFLAFFPADMAESMGLFAMLLLVSGPESILLSVSGMGEIVHKIEDKYIPQIGASALVNGSAQGSVRNVFSVLEDEEYQMGDMSFGWGGKATGYNSIALAGDAIGDHSVSAGGTASGISSFTACSGTASELNSFAVNSSEASGQNASAFGIMTKASGSASFTAGFSVEAASSSQFAIGKYNIVDSAGKYSHIVGNGSNAARSNAHTLDWDGNAWFAGDVYVGGTDQDSGERLMKASDLAPFVVTIAKSGNAGDENYYPDHTSIEVYAAYQAGRSVYAIFENCLLRLLEIEEDVCRFAGIVYSLEGTVLTLTWAALSVTSTEGVHCGKLLVEVVKKDLAT